MSTHTEQGAAPRLSPSRVLVTIGTAGVVAGGLVAAVTGPLDLAKGSWLAAYLVLVVGVGQQVIGIMRARGGRRALADRWGWTQVVGWNTGNAAVVVGSLVSVPALVDVGGGLLVVVLGIALYASGGPADQDRPSSRFTLWGYRFALVTLLVGAPIGMVLAHLRAAG